MAAIQSSKSVLTRLKQKPIHITVAGLLLVALLPLPYGYYQFLRLVIFGAACFFAWQLFHVKRNGWMIIMVLMAILFNPIAPIFFPREVWMLVDLVAANLFVACPEKLTTQPREIA